MPKGRPSKNLEGSRYGRLVVVEKAASRGTNPYWLCRCDCGHVKEARQYSLDAGSIQSCGCFQRETAIKKLEHRFAKDETPFIKHLFRCTKKGALGRGYPFELSLDEFKNLVTGDCLYCGSAPAGGFTNFNRTKGVRLFSHTVPYNGIDRQDNSRGYVADNCVSCCPLCNRIRHTMSVAELGDWVKKVYNRLSFFIG